MKVVRYMVIISLGHWCDIQDIVDIVINFGDIFVITKQNKCHIFGITLTLKLGQQLVKYLRDNMENEHITRIKLHVLNIKDMAEHSKSMSIGAKALINNRVGKILKELEIVELELMARK